MDVHPEVSELARRVAALVHALEDQGLSRSEAVGFARDYHLEFWRAILHPLGSSESSIVVAEGEAWQGVDGPTSSLLRPGSVTSLSDWSGRTPSD